MRPWFHRPLYLPARSTAPATPFDHQHWAVSAKNEHGSTAEKIRIGHCLGHKARMAGSKQTLLPCILSIFVPDSICQALI